MTDSLIGFPGWPLSWAIERAGKSKGKNDYLTA